jgi:hypothetical protein
MIPIHGGQGGFGPRPFLKAVGHASSVTNTGGPEWWPVDEETIHKNYPHAWQLGRMKEGTFFVNSPQYRIMSELPDRVNCIIKLQNDQYPSPVF